VKTTSVRAYPADAVQLTRLAAKRTADGPRTVTVADVIRELIEQAKERGSE
jgi:hypothetical protein